MSGPDPKQKRQRLLLIDHTGELGGAERVLLELLAGLENSGFEAWLACSPTGPLQARAAPLARISSLDLSDTVRTLSRETWHANPWHTLWQARALVQEAVRLAFYARRAQIAFIQTNTLKAHVLGALVARLSGKPLVWHLHDLPSARGDTRALLEWAARVKQPRGIIAVSRAVAADLPSGLKTEIRVVHNGLDLQAFDRAAHAPVARERWMQGPGPILGAVSYLIPWKGLDILLRALPLLISVHPQLKLVIAGAPIFQWRDEPQRLQNLAESLGIQAHVYFLGERNDVPSLLQHVDMFVHPARDEPFGRVLIEAMAARRAVVACDAGGVPEVVINGETGTLVNPGDPQALARAILEVLQEPGALRCLGEAGRQRVAEHFTLEKMQTGIIQAWLDWGLGASCP